MEVLKTTITKEAQEIVDDIQYDVIAISIDGLLTEIGCNIIKQKSESVDDGNGGKTPIVTPIHIGYIRLQNGRIVTEMSSDEDLVKHITKFAEITNTMKSDMENI